MIPLRELLLSRASLLISIDEHRKREGDPGICTAVELAILRAELKALAKESLKHWAEAEVKA